MRYMIQNALMHLGLTKLNNILCLLALTFFILIMNTFLFNHSSIYKELSLKETEAPLVAFANDTVVEDDARVFANQIQKNEQILYIDFITKEENLNRAEKQFGSLGKLIKNGFSGSNPFPASLEIYVSSDNLSRKTLEELAFEIEAYETIDDVIFTGHGILTDIFRQTNRMTIASIAFTVFISFLLIRAAVLKTGRTRDDEIHLINIVGATRGFIRFPFLIQGIVLGIFGPLLGITYFYLLYCIFTFQIGVLEFLPYYQLITIMVSGVIIGVFSGFSAFRKYAKTYKNRSVT